MFNLNQKKSSNNGFIQKIKGFFFGNTKDKSKYSPKIKPVEPKNTCKDNSSAHNGQKERRKRINRRRNELAHQSRMYNYLHA